jgi:RimJ/RimL family protein N-acetyltransferase
MLEAYEAHPDAFTSSTAERAALPLAWWKARLSTDADAGETVFGAWIDGELAGVAGLAVESREKTRHKSTLFGMYVPRRHRQRGLGRSLVEAVLADARRRPATRLVQLTVTAGNAAAQRLYESCGFVAFGTEPLAVRVGGTYVSKVHMWRDLRTSRARDCE